MEKELYRVRTTFLGAGRPSTFYYDTYEKAEKFLNERTNGEIEKVILKADYSINYNYDGCTLDDLTYGSFDWEIIEVEQEQE